MAASLRRIFFLLLLFLYGSFPVDSFAQQPTAATNGPLHLSLKEYVSCLHLHHGHRSRRSYRRRS